MRKRTASGKAHPLAVIILAFFHRFSYHYGALSHESTLHLCRVLFCVSGVKMPGRGLLCRGVWILRTFSAGMP